METCQSISSCSKRSASTFPHFSIQHPPVHLWHTMLTGRLFLADTYLATWWHRSSNAWLAWPSTRHLPVLACALCSSATWWCVTQAAPCSLTALTAPWTRTPSLQMWMTRPRPAPWTAVCGRSRYAGLPSDYFIVETLLRFTFTPYFEHWWFTIAPFWGWQNLFCPIFLDTAELLLQCFSHDVEPLLPLS